MVYNRKIILLKDGQQVLFRSASESDAQGMIEYLKQCAKETDYLLRYPEECTMSKEQEEAFIKNVNASDTNVMIVCEIDGEIAGNCHISFQNHLKTKHRASVAIALISKYWGLGIGTTMFNEMIEVAKKKGVKQLELEYIEGNERARALYDKMGFVEIGVRPDAILLKDGTMLSEISMIKRL